MTLRDLSAKDVIQLKPGNQGIDDVVLTSTAARCNRSFCAGRAHRFGLLGCDDDLILVWESIRTIGTDVIMVDAGCRLARAAADVCKSYIFVKFRKNGCILWDTML